MPLHFTERELAGRREKVVAELQRRGLAALLIFRQESMYYLTGYDTMGYSQFQREDGYRGSLRIRGQLGTGERI